MFWKRLYWISSLVFLGGYTTAGALGVGVGESQHEKIPADARQSPGGYRSFHFWHSGVHGGK